MIYDASAHGAMNDTSTVDMLDGMAITVKTDGTDNQLIYPDKPAQRAERLVMKEFEVSGSGIWNHYFKPVSNFAPSDVSCRIKPLLQMEEQLVTPGLSSYCLEV